MAKINKHIPVMTTNVKGAFLAKPNGVFVDCTLGSGGHSIAILEKLLSQKISSAQIYCTDLDLRAWEYFQTLLETKQIKFTVISPQELKIAGTEIYCKFLHSNFNSLERILPTVKFDFLLADLGPSQNSLEDPSYGLSYNKTMPLDMRLDKNLQVNAADLLQGLGFKQLKQLFRDYGNIKHEGDLAERIVEQRIKRLETTSEFNAIVQAHVADKYGDSQVTYRKILAKVYQALRIAVNLEYDNLHGLLDLAAGKLTADGKVAIITFHSGEEQILDIWLKQHRGKFQHQVSKPQPAELSANPRARSAKLHILFHASK